MNRILAALVVTFLVAVACAAVAFVALAFVVTVSPASANDCGGRITDAQCAELVAFGGNFRVYPATSVEKLPDDARLLLSSHFDVWLDGNRLYYVKDRCGFSADTFFLHVFPADPRDLSDSRKPVGYNNFDFTAESTPYDHGATGRCVIPKRLPDYPIAAIRTGQYEKMGQSFVQLWGEDYRFDRGNAVFVYIIVMSISILAGGFLFGTVVFVFGEPARG